MNEAGSINNATGVIGGSWVDYTWECAAGGTSKNNTVNRSVVHVGFTGVGCGEANFTINSVGDAEFGMDGGEVSYTYHDASITVHPQAPQSFDVTADSYSAVDLDWTNGGGADNTIIRGKQGSYPTSRTDGTTGSTTSL